MLHLVQNHRVTFIRHRKCCWWVGRRPAILFSRLSVIPLQPIIVHLWLGLLSIPRFFWLELALLRSRKRQSFRPLQTTRLGSHTVKCGQLKLTALLLYFLQLPIKCFTFQIVPRHATGFLFLNAMIVLIWTDITQYPPYLLFRKYSK